MKLDDRDIVCEQDYSPLSNAELLTQIEQHTAIMYTSPIIDFDLEWITGPARALLARVEAAERDARNDLDDAELHLRRAEAAATALVARVAELEAQAAQGWRPVTEDWPPYGVQHLGRAMLNSPTLLITRTVNEGDEVWQDNDGLLFYAGEIRYCAAIPAPQETE